MNTGKLVAFGAAGVAAWYFFLRTPSTAATPAAAASVPVKPAGTLDAAFQKMVMKSGGKSGSVDDWNSWLMQGTPAIVAPDPVPLFTAADSNFNRSQQFTAAQYWAVMSPAIAAQYGLSGLGFYGMVSRGGRW